MKVLCVFAHPDDEVLWGWPLLQDARNQRGVLAISDNRRLDNPLWGDRSVQAFHELGKQEGWFTFCGGMPAEFYRLPFRRAPVTLPDTVARIRQLIDKIVADFKPDIVFTHNPIGEYGHADHRLVFELVCTTPAVRQVQFTDICIKNECHVSYKRIPDYLWECTVFFQNRKYEAKVDMYFFERCRAVYQKHNAWTWNHGIAVETGICEMMI